MKPQISRMEYTMVDSKIEHIFAPRGGAVADPVVIIPTLKGAASTLPLAGNTPMEVQVYLSKL